MKKMYFNKRILHRYLAYIVILPLFSTMITGVLYKILLDLFGVEKNKISFLMKIHQMSFLFKNSEVFYTSLLMLLIIGLVVFGYSMIYNPLFGSRTGKNRNRWAPQSMREYHHRYGSVIFVLLLYMAITGGVYRFCRNALNIEKATVGWLMELHHMNYLPNALSIFWIVFVFTAILSIAISGARLLPLVHNLFQSSNSYQILNSSGSSGSSSGSNSNNGSSTSIGINNNVNTSLINSNDDGIGGSNGMNINNSINSSDGGGSIINSNSIEDLSESILIGINDDDEINNPFRPNINNNNNNSDRLESME